MLKVEPCCDPALQYNSTFKIWEVGPKGWYNFVLGSREELILQNGWLSKMTVPVTLQYSATQCSFVHFFFLYCSQNLTHKSVSIYLRSTWVTVLYYLLATLSFQSKAKESNVLIDQYLWWTLIIYTISSNPNAFAHILWMLIMCKAASG